MARVGGSGPNHPRWRGAIKVRRDGRKLIYSPERGTGNSGYFCFEYILIAERALGKSLPKKAVVHHVDEDSTNNGHGNLVICQDQSYHKLLHARADVIRRGGNPNTERICTKCSRPRLIGDFYPRRVGGVTYRMRSARNARRNEGEKGQTRNASD